MPISAQMHILRIGNFYPAIQQIMGKKRERLKRKKTTIDMNSDVNVRTFTEVFTGYMYVLWLCGVVFLLSRNLSNMDSQKDNNFQQDLFRWFGGNIQEGFMWYNRHGVSGDQNTSLIHRRATKEFGSGKNYCVIQEINCLQWYVNSLIFVSLLPLCGDIELNPGPRTEDLIKELGKTIGIRLDAVSGEMQTLSSTIYAMTEQLNTLKQELNDKHEDITSMKETTNRLEERVKYMEEKFEKQEISSRINNVVFYGITETAEEQDSEDGCGKRVLEFLNKHASIKQWTQSDITGAYRLGRRNEQQKKPRPMKVKFVTSKDKRSLIASAAIRRQLKKVGVRINDDLTVKQQDQLKALRDDGYIAYYRGFRLFKKYIQETNQQTSPSSETNSVKNDKRNDDRDETDEEFPALTPEGQRPNSSNSVVNKNTAGDDDGTERHAKEDRGRGRGRSSGSRNSGALRGFGRGGGGGNRASPDRPGSKSPILSDESEETSLSAYSGRTRYQKNKAADSSRSTHHQKRIDDHFRKNNHSN